MTQLSKVRQEQVDELVRQLRLQVIEFLLQEDVFKFRGQRMNKEDLQKSLELIYKIPCCTRNLRRLFDDAHRMHEDKGMMPHPVTIGDLEFCMKYRNIGYASKNKVKFAWLPEYKDSELKKLPAFIELDKIYKNKKFAIPPTAKINNNVSSVVNKINFSTAR